MAHCITNLQYIYSFYDHPNFHLPTTTTFGECCTTYNYIQWYQHNFLEMFQSCEINFTTIVHGISVYNPFLGIRENLEQERH